MLKPVLFMLCAVSATTAEPVTYEVLPNVDSRFALEVAKTGLMSGKTHLFLFSRYSGELRHDPDHPAQSRIRLVIEAASIDCKDDWVSVKDLEKVQRHALDEMLAAERHPEIVFVSETVVPRDSGQFLVEGQLTIRGIMKPVRVNVKMRPDAQRRIRFDGTANVKMTDYGLKPPKAALGLIGTKDEMQVTFSVIGIPTQ